MTRLNDSERLRQASQCLSPAIQKKLSPYIKQLQNTATEIRLRLNRPLSIVCTNYTYYITASGNLTSSVSDKYMLTITKQDIDETFQNICNYSVYTRQNEIINGFVTMQGGHRAGICGTAVISNGRISNIRDISSLNIRIAREHKGCADLLYQKIKTSDKGILICGAPCSGKTTVLRDLARILSTSESKNVSLIDERGELAGTSSGAFQNDIGMCDVFDCYKKSDGISQAVRSMSPDIVMCDEIGSADDVLAIEQAVNSGVTVIATVHAANENELKNKSNICSAVKLGAFKKIVFLSDRSNVGKITRISEAGEIFDF